MNHLLHCLYQHAHASPERDIYVHLDRNACVVRKMSFKTLYERVCVIAKHLTGLTRCNERVLLLYENAFDFIPVFLACLQRGCIPASIQIPNGASKIARLQDLIKNEAISAIILPETLHVKSWFRQLMSEASEIQDMLLPIPAEWGNIELEEYPEPEATIGDRIIYGQLSSGTTGRSKWINITSDNIKANIDAIGLSIHQRPEWNHLCWLPHYHDLGLVAGLFPAICHGNTTWLIDPLDFIGRPQVWPEAMSRYEIHFSHAPNFALDLCVRRISPEHLSDNLNLSSMISIMVCAEPIRAISLQRFHDLFRPFGLGPTPFVTCFGMAECTLAATMQPQLTEYKVVRHPALGKDFVSCGIPVDGTQICIQQVEGQPEGIGEIVLYGSSVSPDHTDKGLLTGDLGFMQDGELYICGRLKEVVILNGKKYLFHEIEDFVETLPFVHDRGALAAALEDDGIESLVLFVELRRDALSKDLRNEQKARIIRRLNREFGITPVDIRFFPPTSLPKSSSGKKSRLPFALLASGTNI